MNTHIVQVINDDNLAYEIFTGKRFYFDVPGLYDKVYDFYEAHITRRDDEVEPVNQLAEMLDVDLRNYFDAYEELQKFQKFCRYHDWYYDYSDDGRVWRKGLEEQTNIRNMLKTFEGKGLGGVAKEIYDYHAPWTRKGSEKVWKTP